LFIPFHTAAAAVEQKSQFTEQDLQRAFQGMQSMMSRMQRTRPLEALFDSQEYNALLEDEQVCEELMQFLPDGLQNKQELVESGVSPHVRQAMHALSQALVTNNFDTVMANFGLEMSDCMDYLQRGDGIGAFLRALQAKADKEKREKK